MGKRVCDRPRPRSVWIRLSLLWGTGADGGYCQSGDSGASTCVSGTGNTAENKPHKNACLFGVSALFGHFLLSSFPSSFSSFSSSLAGLTVPICIWMVRSQLQNTCPFDLAPSSKQLLGGGHHYSHCPDQETEAGNVTWQYRLW